VVVVACETGGVLVLRVVLRVVAEEMV